MNPENNYEILLKSPNDMNFNDIKSLITTKENEIKNILLQKISSLQNEITEKNKKIENMKESINKIKSAYQSNLQLIEERDNDLKAYEEKFDSITNLISSKDIEISKLNENINDLNNKLKYEKSQRMQNEEFNKYTQNKMNLNYQEEVKNLNDNTEKLKNEIEDLKNKISEYEINSKNEKKVFENEKNTLNEKIELLVNEKEKLSLQTIEQKQKLDNLNIQISKLNNDNISIIKEKMGVENKVKILEGKEQENTTNVYLANQRVKFIETELNRTKEDVNNLNSKNENYIKQIDELRNEVFTQKQNVQSKQYEVDKGQFEIKILNSKVNDLNITIDKLLKEKTSIDDANNIALKNYNDQITRLNDENLELKNQNKELNEKITKLANINLSLKESKEIKTNPMKSSINTNNLNPNKVMDDSVDYMKFFAKGSFDDVNNDDKFFKNANINNNNELIQKIEELKSIIKQKDMEIQRIQNEYLSNERILQNKNQELINELNEKVNKEDEIKTIVENLMKRTEEMEEQFNLEKEKIRKDYELKLAREKEVSSKLKKENKKLVKMCSDLKIENNRLENINALNNFNYINNIPSSNEMDNSPILDYQKIDDNDLNEIKQKTYSLIEENKTNDNKNPYNINKEEIKEQTKQRVNNILNFAEYNMMNNSGTNFNSTMKSNYNMSKMDIGNDNNNNNNNINYNYNENILRNDDDNNINNSIDNKELTDFLQITKVDPIEASSNKLKLLKRRKMPNNK